MAKILLVDDDPQALQSTQKILVLGGFEVTTARDGQEALEFVRSQAAFDLIVTDVRMPRLGGLEFLRAISVCGDRTPVILMTAFGRVEDAVWAMKLGAVDFLTKPFKRQALLTAVESVLKRGARRGTSANAGSSSSMSAASQAPGERGNGRSPERGIDRIVGTSPVMRTLKDDLARIAETAATVLLTGDSGTGKELVARCIHDQSARWDRPFVGLNCAAIPEQLIEAELFGHEKGAFTGASGAKQGLFEAASGGTLLLDEIGDMPLGLQSTLLRVLQEGEIRRVGATASRKVDVRVIAATNRDLHDAVARGTFRKDLLYRLEVISLRVPSLAEREGDVRELASHFLEQSARRHGKRLAGISERAMLVLERHSWPGNVRELSNVIERGVVFAQSELLEAEDLPAHLVSLAGPDEMATGPKLQQKVEVALGTPLKDVEDLLIRKTLEATQGDKNLTARLLGINSRTIYRKLDQNKPE